MRPSGLFLLVLLLAASATLLLVEPSDARTIIVDDDWSGADYNTIREALHDASEGDTIRVYDGTYNEDNRVRIPLNLIGNGTDTIIDGTKMSHTHGFILEGGHTNVSGFKFYNWWPTHAFSGVAIESDHNRVFDCTFYYNLRGIFLGNGEHNHILNNWFDKNDYSILTYGHSNNNNISFNRFTRQYNYAILYTQSSGGEIFSNTFENYTSGAMSIDRSDNFTVSFNMFKISDTSTGRRYGVMAYKTSDTQIHNNTFVDHGIAIRAYGNTNLRVEHNTIVGGDEGLFFERTYSGRYKLGPYNNGTIVRYNNVQGQSMCGINISIDQLATIDARYNWWGDASGPYHPEHNVAGIGINATGSLVDLYPWLSNHLSDLPPIAYIVYAMPSTGNEGDDIFLSGRGLARNTTVSHVWHSSIDGEIYRGPDHMFSRADLSNGTHTIFLKVKGEYGKWSTEVSTTLVINGLPRAIIDSISPTLSNERDNVSFRAGYIDDEDDVTGFHWESDIDGILSNSQTFSTDCLSNGTHTITLRVRDGYEAWSPTVSETIVINGIPRAWIKEIEPVSADEGQRVNFDGAYYDHEGVILDHEWVSDLDGVLSDQKTFSTYSLSNGTHTITFRVMDGNATWSGFATSSVTVNGIPRAQIASIAPDKVTQGDVVTFRGGYIDHENDVASYEWTSDIDGTLSFLKDFATSDLSVGSHVITLKVMDRTGIWSGPVKATLFVNGRPLAFIDLVVPEGIDEGGTIELRGSYSDPEDDVHEFLWESDIDGVLSGQLTFKTEGLSRGIHVISFRVRDGFGVWSQDATAAVVVNGIPSASIASIEPSRANQGEGVVLTGAYDDFEDEIVAYEWDSDLDGPLSTDISFTITSLTVGIHAISFRVRDGEGVWSPRAVGTVSINQIPSATILSVSPSEVYQGDLVGFVGEAMDDSGIRHVWWESSIDGPIGDLLTFTRSDLSPGDHVIVLRVADDDGVWSQEVTATVTVLRRPLDLSVEDIAFETPVHEGDEVTIATRVLNLGGDPVTSIAVEVRIDGQVVGSELTKEPLGPDQALVIVMDWMAALGDHTVSIDVLQGGVVQTSSASDVILVVTPVPEEPDPDDPAPVVVVNERPVDTYQLTQPPLVYLVTLIIAVVIVLASYTMLVIGRGGLLHRD